MTRPFLALALATSAALTLTHAALGQCEVFDLEGFASGTEATSVIPGVTITCPPNTCSSEGGLVLPEIYELTGGPDGPNNVISTREGCPDFSPDHLLLTFDENQTRVEFRLGGNLGAAGLGVDVSWYNEFGTRLGIRAYETASHMGLLVTIEAGAAIIRSVEIDADGVVFENIDDIRFGEDTTPPTVEIDAPAFDACVCGDSLVAVTGSVDDPDGAYECDVAEYREVDADPGVPWTQFGSACGAFSGTLHTWSTTGIPEGRYYLRVTGSNTCGLSQSDLTVVRVDRSFGSLSLRPVKEALCGVVTIKGGISDRCGVTWVLEQRPLSGGDWVEIASGAGSVSCELADWDTTTVADGAYELHLSGTDGCGHTAETTQDVLVDNASGCGCTADINGDGVVDVADLVILLSQWS